MQAQIIILAGPTASGKTALAIDIAHKIGAEVINADSQQIYKEIPILTAQPTIKEQEGIPHLLYGAISVRDTSSVAIWLNMAEKAIKEVLERGKIPLLVGGTGLYIKALTEGIATIPDISNATREHIRALFESESIEKIHALLKQSDPETAQKLNVKDTQRVLRAYEVLLETGKSISYWQTQKSAPVFPSEMFSLFFNLPDREKVYSKCNARFVEMLDKGALDEARIVKEMNIPPSNTAMKAHGLRELIAYLDGNMSLEEAIDISQRNTRHYVKRQFTWFRHQMPNAHVVTNSQDILDKCNK